jgi:hypothetical protein
MPSAGGALVLIAGILGLIQGIYLFIALLFLDYYSVGFYFDFGWGSAVVLVCGILALVFSIIAIVGGIFALQRRGWAIAVTGGILGMLAVGFGIGFILGLIGLILVAISRAEFHN